MSNTIVEKEIIRFNLWDWWSDTFSDDERQYILTKFEPNYPENYGKTDAKHFLGEPFPWMKDAVGFLQEMEGRFRLHSDLSIQDRIHKKVIEEVYKNPKSGIGFYKGRRVYSYVYDIRELKRQGEEAERQLESLLLELICVEEEQDDVISHGVWTGFYKELAILYRKQREFSKEVSILKKFVNRKHRKVSWSPYMAERLEKATLLETKYKDEDKEAYFENRNKRKVAIAAKGIDARYRKSRSKRLPPYKGEKLPPLVCEGFTEEEINDAGKAWEDAIPG
ncbi:MAG: hypothetical protein GX825_11035, partial [Syntrophomonadaceae bacterium]|nr:hypothetical protein [Syntrophomonadaceae bacterium]